MICVSHSEILKTNLERFPCKMQLVDMDSLIGEGTDLLLVVDTYMRPDEESEMAKALEDKGLKLIDVYLHEGREC